MDSVCMAKYVRFPPLPVAAAASRPLQRRGVCILPSANSRCHQAVAADKNGMVTDGIDLGPIFAAALAQPVNSAVFSSKPPEIGQFS